MSAAPRSRAQGQPGLPPAHLPGTQRGACRGSDRQSHHAPSKDKQGASSWEALTAGGQAAARAGRGLLSTARPHPVPVYGQVLLRARVQRQHPSSSWHRPEPTSAPGTSAPRLLTPLTRRKRAVVPLSGPQNRAVTQGVDEDAASPAPLCAPPPESELSSGPGQTCRGHPRRSQRGPGLTARVSHTHTGVAASAETHLPPLSPV